MTLLLLPAAAACAQANPAAPLPGGAGAHSSAEATAPEPGSSYVPMGSWIYDALDRLAAFGLIPSQIAGLRPWTRTECLRQTREAEKHFQGSLGRYTSQQMTADLSAIGVEVAGLISALHRELDSFGLAAPSITVQSVYTRNGAIAGPALDDSFHFGQTWTLDNGRPFGRGWNSYTGFTADAGSGRFVAYMSGEYQHAPGSDPYSLAVREAISTMDNIPLPPAVARSDTSRFRAIEAYAGFRLGELEFTAGKQALWWGPTYDAPLSFSNNAEPTKNLRISTLHPIRLWSLAEIRAEFVIGKLGGQQYTWRPWFNAQKLSFKLTDNLEMGFTRWSIFWGVGHPMTLGSFIDNFATLNAGVGGRANPGDRKGGFDFRYRIPGLRNWLTLYTDSYCDDDPSPLASPHRAAIEPGIYWTHVPGIAHLAFRVEAPSTTLMGLDNIINYVNYEYLSGNTNYGQLLGSWVGRDGRAEEAWATYRFSPRNKIELGFRQLKGSAKLIPGGSTQSDLSLESSYALARDLSADFFAQYEKFYIPLLGPRRNNLSSWIQLTWEPNLQILQKRN
jgi:hypothetical protein